MNAIKMMTCALAMVAITLTPALNAKDGASGTRLRAKLTGPAIATVTPMGEAQFKSNTLGNRSELEVEVEHVSLPAGTALDVQVKGVSVGTIKLHTSGEGELDLDSQSGAAVPAVVKGDTVSVLNAGVVIMTGVF